MSGDHFISVVVDDRSLRLAIASLLRSIGYRATSHASAYEFLISGDIERTDCIVVDVHLLGGDGIDARHQPDRIPLHSKVIVITADQAIAARGQPIEIGPFFFLKKPFDAEELIECVERSLGIRDATPAS